MVNFNRGLCSAVLTLSKSVRDKQTKHRRT